MCFSTAVSIIMILGGLAVAAFSPRGWIRLEVLFVVLMEVFQLIGILLADRCDHPLNGPITYLSLIHISLQPWTYQEWQWALSAMRGGNSFSPEHKRLVRGLAAAFAVGMWFRMIPCQTETGCHYCAEREHFCASDGSPACTRMGVYHIYWRLPLRPVNAFFPGLWGHFALTILPGIINGDRFEQIQMLLLFFTGAAAMFYVAYKGNPETAFDEGPSLWCIVAIPQHFMTYVVVLLNRNAGGPAKRLAPDVLVSVDNFHARTSSAGSGKDVSARQRRRQRL